MNHTTDSILMIDNNTTEASNNADSGVLSSKELDLKLQASNNVCDDNNHTVDTNPSIINNHNNNHNINKNQSVHIPNHHEQLIDFQQNHHEPNRIVNNVHEPCPEMTKTNSTSMTNELIANNHHHYHHLDGHPNYHDTLYFDRDHTPKQTNPNQCYDVLQQQYYHDDHGQCRSHATQPTTPTLEPTPSTSADYANDPSQSTPATNVASDGPMSSMDGAVVNNDDDRRRLNQHKNDDQPQMHKSVLDHEIMTTATKKCSLIDCSSATLIHAVTTATTSTSASMTNGENLLFARSTNEHTTTTTTVLNGMSKCAPPQSTPNDTDCGCDDNLRAGDRKTDKTAEQRDSLGQLIALERRSSRRQRTVVRKFQKMDSMALTSTPAPDVKIGQRVAYKEYYGSEFGTIRWIGRVPQISIDWTVGVEFDNAIGEGDGSLNGRRYFIAKDCFAKFLPLDQVALVDQHVGRPEPGTMISVMSAAVRPGQMISIQRVSTVHVQHCFLNAPHRIPGAEFLAVNTRLHCQCPNCGPCAHVVKPPRTQRLRTGKNATHMCQFSTYTCCGMESQEEAMCTYTGNKISSSPPPAGYTASLPPIGNSWFDGAGYLTNLQAEQTKLMPEEYKLGAAPEDIGSSKMSRRSGGGHSNNHHHHHHHHDNQRHQTSDHHHHHHQGQNNHHEGGNHHHRHHKDNHNKGSGRSLATSPRSNSVDRHHEQPSAKLECNKQIGSQYEKSPANVDENHGSECKAPVSPVYTNLYKSQCTSPDCCRQHNADFAHKQSLPGQPGTEHTDDNRLALANPGKGCAHSTDTYDAPVVNGSDLCSLNNGFAITNNAMGVRDPNDTDSSNRFNERPCPTMTTTTMDDNNNLAASVDIKGPKVLYRDSIENRYLFPTDDVIDSTLEADLENLSQARYGHSGWANGRQTGSTRTIMRSLRSLVSCLKTKSTNSELGPQSENTMRIYDRPANGYNNKTRPTNNNHQHHHHHHHHHHDHQPNKTLCNSERVMYRGCSASELSSISSIHKTEPAMFNKYPPPPFESSYHTHKSNSLIASVGNNNNNTRSPNPPNYHSHSDQQYLRSQCERFEGRTTSSYEKHGSNGTNSSYGCWSSCGRLTNGEVKTIDNVCSGSGIKEEMHTVEQFRRQISSSSDCGFSSASQNSINFGPSSMPSCTLMNGGLEDEKIRMNHIYNRIASRLISSTNSISREDLLKLKGALFEMHSESCCLHTTTTTTHSGDALTSNITKSTFETNDCDQIIADIFKKTYLDANSHNGSAHNSKQREPPVLADQQQQQQKGNVAKGEMGDLLLLNLEDSVNEHGTNSNGDDDDEKLNHPAESGFSPQQRTPLDSQTTKSSENAQITLAVDGMESQTVEAPSKANGTNLPKAFELKLTLSINNSEQKNKEDITANTSDNNFQSKIIKTEQLQKLEPYNHVD